jgi:hypothetical protein
MVMHIQMRNASDFLVDADTDPTFYPDADPDPDQDPSFKIKARTQAKMLK